MDRRQIILDLLGADRDVVPVALATAMPRRGRRAARIDFPGIGHAPPLNVAAQIETVRTFLRQ